MTTRYLRQLRIQRAAVDLIRRHPELMSDPRLIPRLDGMAANVSGGVYRRAVSRWRELLASEDVERLSVDVLADNPEGAYLRTVSPLGVLLDSNHHRMLVGASPLATGTHAIS